MQGKDTCFFNTMVQNALFFCIDLLYFPFASVFPLFPFIILLCSRSPQVGILPIVIQSNGVNNYLSFSICVSSYFSNFFAK